MVTNQAERLFTRVRKKSNRVRRRLVNDGQVLLVDVLSKECLKIDPDTVVRVAPTQNGGMLYSGMPYHLHHLCPLEQKTLNEVEKGYVLVQRSSGLRLFKIVPR